MLSEADGALHDDYFQYETARRESQIRLSETPLMTPASSTVVIARVYTAPLTVHATDRSVSGDSSATQAASMTVLVWTTAREFCFSGA
jgi:hypothetical protein